MWPRLLHTHVSGRNFELSIHSNLTLDGFQQVFYIEYTHRMWGRLTGLVSQLASRTYTRKERGRCYTCTLSMVRNLYRCSTCCDYAPLVPYAKPTLELYLALSLSLLFLWSATLSLSLCFTASLTPSSM